MPINEFIARALLVLAIIFSLSMVCLAGLRMLLQNDCFIKTKYELCFKNHKD